MFRYLDVLFGYRHSKENRQSLHMEAAIDVNSDAELGNYKRQLQYFTDPIFRFMSQDFFTFSEIDIVKYQNDVLEEESMHAGVFTNLRKLFMEYKTVRDYRDIPSGTPVWNVMRAFYESAKAGNNQDRVLLIFIRWLLYITEVDYTQNQSHVQEYRYFMKRVVERLEETNENIGVTCSLHVV